MNYLQLRTMVADWCHRSDMASAIASSVSLATAHFNRVLRTPEMESRDNRTIVSEFASLPSDFIEIIGVVRDDGKELRYLARPQLSSYVSLGARPEPPVYSIEDYQLRIQPAPSASAPLDVTILYYEQIPPLSADADTNWLLTAYPDAYLYGTLMHARTWLHDDARTALVKPMFDEALGQVQRRKVVAAGVASAIGSDVPSLHSTFDISRGW